MTSSILEWIGSLSWSDPNVRGAVYTIVATLALIVSFRLLAGFFRRVRRRYEAQSEERRAGLRVQQWEVFSAGGYRRSVRFILGVFHALVVFVLIDIYVALVLGWFPRTQPLADRYFEFVTDPVVASFEAIAGYMPDLLYIVVVSALTLFGLRFLRLFFRAVESGKVSIPGFFTDWSETTYKLVRLLVLVFLLAAIFPHLPGADEQAFKSVSIFVGALVTLGSTAAVGNAVAGVVLVYTRAFQVGDWIKVRDNEGEVMQRELLVTRLLTAANEVITIPNGEVLRDHVVNYSPAARAGKLGFSVEVRIGYSTDWRTVEQLLLKAAAATPGLTMELPPVVLQRSLDDMGVKYLIRVGTGQPPPLGTMRTALGRNILDEFERAGVEILTPEVSVLRGDDDSVFPVSGEHGRGSEPFNQDSPADDG